jgi:hypothetical protein
LSNLMATWWKLSTIGVQLDQRDNILGRVKICFNLFIDSFGSTQFTRTTSWWRS